MPDPGNMLETSFFNFPRVCQCLFDKLLSGIIWGSISKVFSLHFSSPMTSMNRYTLWKDPINSINIRSSDSKRALRFINCTKAIIMNLGCFAAPALAVKLYRKYLRNRTRIKNNKHKSYVINVRLHSFDNGSTRKEQFGWKQRRNVICPTIIVIKYLRSWLNETSDHQGI